jgi:hypothetical protein
VDWIWSPRLLAGSSKGMSSHLVAAVQPCRQEEKWDDNLIWWGSNSKNLGALP